MLPSQRAFPYSSRRETSALVPPYIHMLGGEVINFYKMTTNSCSLNSQPSLGAAGLLASQPFCLNTSKLNYCSYVE